MKRLARKKKPEETVVIPPDILEEPQDSQNSIEETTDISFYEKVTGKKPEISQDVENGQKDLPQIEKNNRKLFFLGGVVFFITIIVTTSFGLYIISNQNSPKKETAVKEIEPTPTVAPSPIEFDRSKVSFEVLNGSGEAGKAKKTADAIEALGYEISETGNAGSSNYKGVTVSFGVDVNSDDKLTIIKDLEGEFLSVNEDESQSLDFTSSVLLIVGK